MLKVGELLWKEELINEQCLEAGRTQPSKETLEILCVAREPWSLTHSSISSTWHNTWLILPTQ